MASTRSQAMLATRPCHQSRFNDCRGSVLIVSLIMLVVLTLMGALVLNLAGVELQTSAFEKMSTRAFFSAESGVTQVRNDMQAFVAANPQNGQWPALDTAVITGVLGNGNPPRQYEVAVPGLPSISFTYTMSDIGTNNDRTVLVTSTGTVQGVQQRVEAVIRYEPPDQVGAQDCVSAGCTSADQSSGGAVVNNENSTVTL